MTEDWPRITDLIGAKGEVALLGAPLNLGSVTSGRCDLAPAKVREALRRFSRYDLESGTALDVSIADAGDVSVARLMPADAFAPIRDAVAACTARHALTLLIGGNNAVTRSAAHGLGVPLSEVGLITLDAHFDLRSTEGGPINGNPIRCLLEDGLPGHNICQIGLAPFANTEKMHRDALASGIGVYSAGGVKARGISAVLDEALDRLGHVSRIMIDFDIDVIDRAQCPGAPGARPGGIPADMFFTAARILGGDERVVLADLTEFDPALDLGDITALTAARWVCEMLSGFAARSSP